MLIKALKIKDPVVTGVAIGTSSHVVGTARALELGETEGAMSAVAIGVTGVATVLIAILD
ncbi:MAG: LrgB family protein [Synergistaceae bacterium]|nr:LrgB family protein [Synergistaceae bacterium]